MSKTRGFTIVELLIVIVVIAVLAAITIVAYNGIQVRAKNTKTLNAAAAWIKILHLHKADKQTYPSVSGCLGSMTTYDTLCWPQAGWSVKQAFLDQVAPYTSSYPEPDTTDIANGANSPRKGLMYNTDMTSYWRIYLFQARST